MIDGGTNQRVAYAELALIDSAGTIVRTTHSDSAGFFALSGRAGTHWLRVTGLGYAQYQSQPVKLHPGEVVSVVIPLTAQGIPLKPIEVQARGGEERGRYGFDRRMALGKGHFITVDSIRAKRPAVITDLFYTIPGVDVYESPRSRFNVYSLFGYKCLVVYRDNVPIPVTTGIRGRAELRDQLRGGLGGTGIRGTTPYIRRVGMGNINDLEIESVRAIEVYRDASELPDELKTAVRMLDIWPDFQPEPCGMVWIWTGLGW